MAGRLLEVCSNADPRGMAARDRIRLIVCYAQMPGGQTPGFFIEGIHVSLNRKKSLARRDLLTAESGTIFKTGQGAPSIALAYANTYFLGMSNLGFQTLYALFNADPDCICERVFMPDARVDSSSSVAKPLRTVESGRIVHDFDALAFSISFENDYLHVLPLLDLAGIPFLAKDRSESDPIVIAGGAAITINPEPIRAFCDVLFVGEAEEAAQEIVEALRAFTTRAEKIEALGKIEGCYISAEVDFSTLPALPSSICPASTRPNSLEERVPLTHLRLYRRRVPENINDVAIQTVIHTPYSEFGKLSLIEVQRGCGRGCKFCAEGFIYTPFRQRDYPLIQQQVLRALKVRDKIGLIGADLLVYPQILDLMKFIHASGGTFSPSSVRVDALSDDIIEQLALSGHRTMAIAPEAGSDEQRHQLNKKFNNAQILDVIERLLKAGIPNIKMYLMIGLPHEEMHHIDEMIQLVDAARQVVLRHAKATGRMGALVLSLNPFIPKPRTPWQVGVFEGIESLEKKITSISKRLLPKGGIRIYHENPFFAYVQALLSNGQVQMSQYLLEVFAQGGALRKALRKFELQKLPQMIPQYFRS